MDLAVTAPSCPGLNRVEDGDRLNPRAQREICNFPQKHEGGQRKRGC